MVTFLLFASWSRCISWVSWCYGRGSCSHHSPFHSMRLWSHFIWLPLFLPPPPAESFQSILPAFIYCITSLTSTSTTTVLTMPAVFSFCRSSAIQELAQRPVSCLSLSGGVNQSVASGLFQEVPALQPNNLRGGWRRKGRWENGVFKKAFLFPNWSNVMFPPFHATQLSSSIALIQLIDRVNMLC